MKQLKNKILHLLKSKGYLIFEEKLFKKRYQLKSEFNPLQQLFYQRLHSDFFFVQIGANDGISFDPIYHLVTGENVQGITLEPVGTIFEKLKKNYENYPKIRPVNKGIHKTQKLVSLYRVDPDKKYPDWTKGTASFNKCHHQLGGIAEEDIIEEKVECISFENLIKDYAITRIDLLQIDTEGYDYDIIKMIDFDKISPSIICFEHGLESGIMSKEKMTEIQEIFFKYHYNIIVLENDAIAYKPI